MDIQESEILEQVFLNKDYQIVSEKEADFIRIRLKDGRTFYGVPRRKKTGVRVVLKTEQDFQHAN